MATKKKSTQTVDAYYIRSKGVEIGPFRSRSAALAEAKAIEASGDKEVKIAQKRVAPKEFDFSREGEGAVKHGKKTKDDDEDSRYFDDDDEGDDEEEDEDDEEEDDDEDEDEDDEPPAVTHPFFRPIGKGKK